MLCHCFVFTLIPFLKLHGTARLACRTSLQRLVHPSSAAMILMWMPRAKLLAKASQGCGIEHDEAQLRHAQTCKHRPVSVDVAL